jgi:hypothetical protein
MSNYTAYITKIKNLKKHENADRLQIGDCFGNSVIVGSDTMPEEVGVYFPTDGQLGIEYAEVNNLLRKKDENGKNIGGYLDPDKRHIKAIKLRGEKSDGLFMPLKSLEQFCDISGLRVGDTISILSGIVICEKYVPKSNTPKTSAKSNMVVKSHYFPTFYEHINTEQLAYNLGKFVEGDICYITLKMHGTSQRTANIIQKKVRKLPNIISKIIKLRDKTVGYKLVSGTRRTILTDFKGGYYGSDEFRKAYHDFFEGKLRKGEEVYYEIVGYANSEKLIMPECSNAKTQDKNFVDRYGETTRFTYGCNTGESKIYVYRMTTTNEDGYIVEMPTELVKIRCEQMGVDFVPILDKFLFTSQEDLLSRVERHIEGDDPIGKTHIREGIVVRIDNREKFTALKHKSFLFKVLEGIIKDCGIVDIEEEQGGQADV